MRGGREEIGKKFQFLLMVLVKKLK